MTISIAGYRVARMPLRQLRPRRSNMSARLTTPRASRTFTPTAHGIRSAATEIVGGRTEWGWAGHPLPVAVGLWIHRSAGRLLAHSRGDGCRITMGAGCSARFSDGCGRRDWDLVGVFGDLVRSGPRLAFSFGRRTV